MNLQNVMCKFSHMLGIYVAIAYSISLFYVNLL